jgi:hypothetical protein
MVELWLSNRKNPQQDLTEQESCHLVQVLEITTTLGIFLGRRSDFESAASASSAIPAEVASDGDQSLIHFSFVVICTLLCRMIALAR